MSLTNVADQAGWEHLGETSFFQLPAATISDFVARSGALVIVMHDEDGLLVGDRQNGHNEIFARFAEVDAYVRRRCAEILGSRGHAMALEVGLDPSAWTFNHSDRFVFFESVGSPKVRLERHAETRWAVVLENLTVGFASTPLKAYALLRR